VSWMLLHSTHVALRLPDSGKSLLGMFLVVFYLAIHLHATPLVFLVKFIPFEPWVAHLPFPFPKGFPLGLSLSSALE